MKSLLIAALIILASVSAYAHESIWGFPGYNCIWGIKCGGNSDISGGTDPPPVIPPPSGPSPVASYNFNNGAGGSAFTDRTGNGHTGTCTNCPTHDTSGGPTGDGAWTWSLGTPTDIVTLDTSAAAMDLHSNNAFSIAYDTNVTTMGFEAFIISRAGQFTLAEGVLEVNPQYKILDAAITPTVSETSDYSEFDGLWNHVAFVFEGNTGVGDGHFHIYINGEHLYHVEALSGTLGSVTADTKLGADSGGAARGFIGQIDNLRIYNIALTGAQATALIGLPVPGDTVEGGCTIGTTAFVGCTLAL
jgi:hypothetical protein